jgi:uncharacterized membrane protein
VCSSDLYEKYNIHYRDDVIIADNADMAKQFEFIKENKFITSKIFLNSYSREFIDMITSYIGRLGWGDTQLPNWFVLINYIIIIVLAFSGNEMKLKFNMLQRTGFVLVFLGLTLFIMLSQYLTWDKVGSDKVYPAGSLLHSCISIDISDPV